MFVSQIVVMVPRTWVLMVLWEYYFFFLTMVVPQHKVFFLFVFSPQRVTATWRVEWQTLFLGNETVKEMHQSRSRSGTSDSNQQLKNIHWYLFMVLLMIWSVKIYRNFVPLTFPEHHKQWVLFGYRLVIFVCEATECALEAGEGCGWWSGF